MNVSGELIPTLPRHTAYAVYTVHTVYKSSGGECEKASPGRTDRSKRRLRLSSSEVEDILRRTTAHSASPLLSAGRMRRRLTTLDPSIDQHRRWSLVSNMPNTGAL